VACALDTPVHLDTMVGPLQDRDGAELEALRAALARLAG
jgi:hypothetical protein